MTILNGTSIVGVVNVGPNPYWATYDSGNGYIYVSSYDDGNLSVLNGTSLVDTIHIGGSPYYSTYDSDDGFLYVTDGGYDVAVINGLSVVGYVRAGSSPWYLSYDSVNGFVYSVNSGGYAGSGQSSVSIINGTTVLANLSVGDYPWFSVYDAFNGYVYVSNSNATNVSVINGTRVIASVSVGIGPVGLAYDSGNGFVYVANIASGNVSVIMPPVALYPIKFDEVGLGQGKSWSVRIDHSGDSTSSSALTLAEPRGTYRYTASSPGFQTTMGNVTVLASPANLVRIDFSPSPTGVSSGASASILGLWESALILAVAVVIAVAILYRRQETRMESGRAAVHQLTTMEWGADENGDPVPRSSH
ncbi:MAG: YncE family protein [Thermoplasmata archaeon]